MNWNKAKADGFVQVEALDPNGKKYVLRLSPKSYTPSENASDSNGNIEDDNDTQYLRVEIEGLPSTDKIKQELLKLQESYGKSDEVNLFSIPSVGTTWISQFDRVVLLNDLALDKEDNLTQSDIWFNGTKYTVDTDYAYTFIKNLERYARKTYEVTQKHIQTINGLTSREELLAYDVSAGYPEIISFDVTKVISINDQTISNS